MYGSWEDFPDVLSGKLLSGEIARQVAPELLAWAAKWRNITKPWGPWRASTPEDAANLLYQALSLRPPQLVLVCKSPASFNVVSSLVTTYGFCNCGRSELRRRLREDVWTKNEPYCWGPWPLTVLGDVSLNLQRVGDCRPGRNVTQRYQAKRFLYDRYQPLVTNWGHVIRVGTMDANFPEGAVVPWSRPTNDVLQTARRRYGRVGADITLIDTYLDRGASAYWYAIIGSYCFKKGASFKGDIIDRALCNLMRKYSGFNLYENIAVFCEFPRVSLVNAEGNSHSVEYHAVHWADGFKVHALDGIHAPDWAFDPNSFTARNVRKVNNIELRRRLIAKLGSGRYVEDLGGVEVDVTHKSHPVLGLREARLLYLPESGNQEEMYVVEVVNSTPEPDGSYNLYHMTIDPNRYNGRAGRNVLAAVASTWRDFGNRDVLGFTSPEDYHPLIES